jgi:ribosomal protein S18 acetylase RimI-like enzyme
MQIRHARQGDEGELAFLLEDHERHYGHPLAPGSGAAGAAYLLGQPTSGTICLVAQQDDGKLVGFAILNPYFPGPRLTHGLYLKELYVAGTARSAGVGEKLIEAIRALARKRGDTRVLWTTGEDNTGAQRFYDRLGMRREKKVYYVMDV